MKPLFAVLILLPMTGPGLAFDLAPGAPVLAPSVLVPADDDLGRRSGACPFRPDAPVLPGQVVARERSTNGCGGV